MKYTRLISVLLLGTALLAPAYTKAADRAAVIQHGIVEGFYGTPWTMSQRQNLLEFCAKHDMNTYIYAPKDDPYHREHWRDSYPAATLSQLTKLKKQLHKAGMEFIFAISPGNDLSFDGMKGYSDRRAMLHKLEELYSAGFRSFAIFFDDITDHSGAQQAEFISFITSEFIETHPDCPPLLVVPTEYYLKDMKQDEQIKTYTREFSAGLPEAVTVLFTGQDVCPDGLKQEDLEEFSQLYPRQKIGVWWNYPVNDYMRQRPALGPVDKLPSQPGNVPFFFNPMEYPQLSCLTLATAAEYCRNPAAYDSEAAWKNAIKEQYGLLAPEMRLFAEEHQRFENDWAHIGRQDSPELKKLYQELFSSNENTQSLASELLNEEEKRLKAAQKLKSKLPGKLLKELKPALLSYIDDKEACIRLLKKLTAPDAHSIQIMLELKELRQEMTQR